MDSGLLEDMELHPQLIGAAKLDDYRIHIGDRATLIHDAGSVAYGILMDLPDNEASALYSRPEVSGYAAEPVNVSLLEDGATRPAVCYILPAEALSAETNTAYADKLAALVQELGFPSTYARDISEYGSGA